MRTQQAVLCTTALFLLGASAAFLKTGEAQDSSGSSRRSLRQFLVGQPIGGPGTKLCDLRNREGAGATAAGPYSYSRADNCGRATSLSTYPYVNPYDSPGVQDAERQDADLLGSKGTQGFPFGGTGGFMSGLGRKLKQGVTVVTSTPTSVSNPINIYNPSVGGLGYGNGYPYGYGQGRGVGVPFFGYGR